MNRLDKKSKRREALGSSAMRERHIREMEARVRILALVDHLKMEEEAKEENLLWGSFQKAMRKTLAEGPGSDWCQCEPKLGLWERILLEYACGTGEMRNHEPLAVHCDGNKSHLLESMTGFPRYAKTDYHRSATDILKDCQKMYLAAPFDGFCMGIQPGKDAVALQFARTWHAPDHSRGEKNTSFCHGP